MSTLLSLEVPPRTAMEVAGHSALAIAMNVYARVALDDTRTALAKLGQPFEEGAR